MNRFKSIGTITCAVALAFTGTFNQGWCAANPEVPALRYYRQVERGAPQQFAYDVAVYGGTPAGVTAAIQAARMGKKSVLLSFNRHVGGMTSGGLTATDVGNKDTIGGLALEYYETRNPS